MYNSAYTIRRSVMYAALAARGVAVKSDKIPLGATGEWENVEVEVGWTSPAAPKLVLPKVRLEPKGVANRVRVLCPACRAAWVRFGSLAQHAGTVVCQKANARRLATPVVETPADQPAVEVAAAG